LREPHGRVVREGRSNPWMEREYEDGSVVEPKAAFLAL
jgi:hypothetical protein